MDQLRKVMHAVNYAPLSFKNYARELEFLFSYYPDNKLSQLSREEVIDYVCYIKDVHHASYAKLKMVSNAIKFFYSNVLNSRHVIPSKLYPRLKFRLPVVMQVNEVELLLNVITNRKHRAIIELAYSTGMRVGEVSRVRMEDIKRGEYYIRVVGKGNHCLFFQSILQNRHAEKPDKPVHTKQYLFS